MTINALTGRPVHRWLRFHLISRLAILLPAGVTVLLAWLVPASVSARILADGGGLAHVVLMIMTVISLIGVADAIVNDLLPDCFALPWARRHRHLGYMVLGGTYLAQAMAALSPGTPGGAIVVAYYISAGAVCGLFCAAAVSRPHHAL